MGFLSGSPRFGFPTYAKCNNAMSSCSPGPPNFPRMIKAASIFHTLPLPAPVTRAFFELKFISKALRVFIMRYETWIEGLLLWSFLACLGQRNFAAASSWFSVDLLRHTRQETCSWLLADYQQVSKRHDLWIWVSDFLGPYLNISLAKNISLTWADFDIDWDFVPSFPKTEYYKVFSESRPFHNLLYRGIESSSWGRKT